MPSPIHAVASVVTSNYIPQATTLFSYIKETNPEAAFIVLIIGEADSLPKTLPTGPEWICWDRIFDRESRLRLATEYTPFELSCVVRGRFHHYLATQREFAKWVMLDTDIGVMAELLTAGIDPLNAIKSGIEILRGNQKNKYLRNDSNEGFN
jgi:hypothetical protein